MEQKTEITQYHFDTIVKDFLGKIESLNETLPFVMIFIRYNYRKANNDFATFVKDKGVSSVGEDGEESYTFSPEDSQNYFFHKRNIEKATNATDIVPESLFVTLISQFDSFLGRLIKEIFNVKPDILNASEKNLTYSRLLEFASLEEAKEYLIEKEVEAVLRESHIDHFGWLENKLGIVLRKDLPIWETFVEITERRNLFVHCDGIVSSQYLSVCRHNKIKLDEKVGVGTKFEVSPDYFVRAYKCLYEIAVKLTQVIWRKLLPKDLEKADESLNDICFELLKQGHFDLSDILLDFATNTLKKYYNEESRNVFIVNKALSLKLGGKIDKAHDIVNNKDWSACSDKFKIAKEALLDNFEEVERLMRKIGPDGDVKKLSYKVWPLFASFRKTDGFINCYKDVFREDYKAIETPKKLIEQLFQEVEKEQSKKPEPKEVGTVSELSTAEANL
ncbi:hypothetical protein SAMN05444008_11578 [Cnuella takakiae]|uniref:HEPN domain-containing protein n=1 Tax=Cnuella takakiae TaxID=1302690 RepID=A0A1M5G2L5_9BACT|nr:hypothetical protein [Cnuella takakiae]OLY92312.1 hypothetical protein BUE76_10700 [Cnuella takakiae]SHF98067.1 hypothetical protein SAMN05444008_11578 [Cnuella takakiae]